MARLVAHPLQLYCNVDLRLFHVTCSPPDIPAPGFAGDIYLRLYLDQAG